MGLGELEMNIFAGESIKITGPAHVNVQGGLSASVMQNGGMMAKGKAAFATAGGTKAAGLVGGGKVSAVKVSAASGSAMKVAGYTVSGATLSAMLPTVLTIAAFTAGGFLLYKLNSKVMGSLDSVTVDID